MELTDLSYLKPEIFLLTMACVLLLVEAFGSKQRVLYSYILSMLTLITTMVLVAAGMPEAGETQLLMEGSVTLDAFASMNKLFILGVSLLVLQYSRRYMQERDIETGEYYIIAIFAVLGMLVMTMSNSMLVLYMGLELMSLSLYALIALHRKVSRSIEAAMKYFVLGAIASGMLLYGIALIYGLTGTLELHAVGSVLSNSSDRMMVLLALSLVLIGLAFKLGVAPFHMWLPDVYHGAPTSITLFVSAAPKIAVFVILARFLFEGMPFYLADWQGILAVLAVLSMVIGNVIAIAQTNLKRMLAYSAISHAGFFLLGVLSGTQTGIASAMFYMVVYAFTTAAVFGVMLLLSRRGFEAEELNDYKGLGRSHPWLAVLMTILMLSMAGVPPMIGFHAKFAVIQEVLAIDMVWLAIVAVAMAVIGVFYYLRVVVYMYFHDVDQPATTVKYVPALDAMSVVSVNTLAVLLLGLAPAIVKDWCVRAVSWMI
jgi:NADH-quinone oxidoreductase subunit N